jgi:separase
MLTYWTSVRDRYRARIVDASISSESDINCLPDNWMVVHIAVNEAKDTLFMSRQRPNQTPLVFCVPLARTSRKENDGTNAQLTFDAAVQELKDIIELNTTTSKKAASVQSQDREARGCMVGRAKCARYSAQGVTREHRILLVGSIQSVWLCLVSFCC